MLSVLSHSESALQRMHEELQVSPSKLELFIDVTGVFISARVCQRVELTVRQLTEEKSALELCLKQLEADKEQLCTDAQHTQKELKHTLDMLSRYKHTLTLALCQLVDFSMIFLGIDVAMSFYVKTFYVFFDWFTLMKNQPA